MRTRIKAYLLGMVEFRSAFTSHVGGDLIEDYDAGRDMAHRLTLRHWDDC